MQKILINSDVKNVDLSPLGVYVVWNSDSFKYFDLDPGQNHCKLLGFISQQLSKGSKIADLGTYHGQSAAALAFNPGVVVTTYDVTDNLPSDKLTCKNLPNVKFIQDDATLYNFASFDIVFLDIAPHDSVQEEKIFARLLEKNFQGLLICDDIYYSDAMKSWWNSIQLKKYDVTHYGHWSGTGLVVFNPDYIDVEIS